MSELTERLRCDKSWEKHILDVMERDHPGLLEKALGTAVSENAVRMVAKRQGQTPCPRCGAGLVANGKDSDMPYCPNGCDIEGKRVTPPWPTLMTKGRDSR